MPSLRLTAPGHPPTVYNLYKKITSLGSGPDNDIVLPDPLVVDGFAVHFDGQTYTVLAPKKAEFVVNGKKRGKHKLSHDDRLVLGSCELRFAMIDEAAPLEEEAAETIAELDAYTKLYEFSERLIHQRDLSELLDALMDAVIGITNADKGFLVLLEGDTIDVKVARNLNRENIADAVSQLSDSIIAKVVRSRKPVIVSDAMRDDEFSAAKSVMQLKSADHASRCSKGEALGLIYVGNDSIRDLFQRDGSRCSRPGVAHRGQRLQLHELRVDNKRLSRHRAVRFGGSWGPARRRCSAGRRSPRPTSRADHRRDRHRQGADRARAARALAARQAAVHHHQLRRDPGEPARVRAVRPRQGRVHRRGRQQAGQVPGGRRRHAVPRRDRRDADRAPGQDPARAAGARGLPGRRHPARDLRYPDPGGDQPRPREGDRERAVSRRPLLPAQRRQRRAAAAARPRRGYPRGGALLVVAHREYDVKVGPVAQRRGRIRKHAWPGNIRARERIKRRSCCANRA